MKTRILPAAIMLVGVLVSCGGAADTGPKADLQIGAYLPLTGTASAAGTAERNGYQMGIDQINSTGGVNGHHLKLTVKDDQGPPETSTTTAAELGADPAILAVLGTYGSNLAIPSSAALEKAKVPNLQPLASDTQMTKRGFRYLFDLYGPTPTTVEPLINYIKAGGFKPTRVAFLYTDGPAGAESSGYFKQALASMGASTVANEKIQYSASSFASTITRLKAANADMVFAHLSTPAQFKVVLTDMGNQDYRPKYFFSFGTLAMDPTLAQSSGPLVTGMMHGVHWYAAAPFKGNATFVADYKAKYGGDPPLAAATGYQTVQVLVAALKQTKNDQYTRESIREALTKVSIDTVAGPVKFDSEGLSSTPGLVVQTLSSGTAVLFSDIDKKLSGKPIDYRG
jgi:branched-chain amino acid transport system substrate-binding protein